MQIKTRTVAALLCMAVIPTLTVTTTAQADEASGIATEYTEYTEAQPIGQDVDGPADEFFLPTSIASSGVTSTEGFHGTGDIADAGPNVSFDPVPTGDPVWQPSSVFGTDQRTRVNGTTAFPNRSFARVSSSGGTCSGFLFGPDLVVTAGHCIHPGGTGRGTAFYSNVRVSPGQNGTSYPYGTCSATQLWTDVAWTESADPRQDWGAIRLNCKIGNTTGWIGMRWQTGSFNDQYANVRGYPAEKRPVNTMWTHGEPIRQTAGNQLFYTIDTSGGQSGSPVFIVDSGSQLAIAIHAYGTSNVAYNKGTRITRGLFDFLISLQ
ncbi:glutamyl endopeptidase [Actinoalloteichus hoggarensis]|nr:trypsin-like peptidase domain-containing protein [Actinoalloteichus hoggarensis]MBB5924301.1 glutamyl endopeptidase [Actinoalloteichus hoggarensis]